MKAVARPLRSVHAGDARLASHMLAPKTNPTLVVTSPDLARVIGTGAPPTLVVAGVPKNARSLVVLCEDPDAPMPHPFLHWSVYWLDGRDMVIDANALAGAAQGKNTALEIGYAPPNAPRGSAHHYHFQVFALDYALPGSPRATEAFEGEFAGDGVAMGAGRNEIFEAMRGHVIAWGEVIGVY